MNGLVLRHHLWAMEEEMTRISREESSPEELCCEVAEVVISNLKLGLDFFEFAFHNLLVQRVRKGMSAK